MTNFIAITKARVNLGSIVKRVRLGKERFVLEKDGYPVAALIDIDEFEDFLDSQNNELKQDLKKSRAQYRAGKGRPVEELFAKMRKKHNV